MSITRIKVRRDGDNIIVQSNDINIKQAFFSWASWGTGMNIKEHPEFYGRSAETGRAVRAGRDEEMWQWDLSEESANDLIEMMRGNLGELPTEVKASQDVMRALLACLEGNQEELDEFTEAYIEAALWSSSDDADDPLEDHYGVHDIASESMVKIKSDCQKFQQDNAELLAAAYEMYAPRDGYTGPALAGHDFWLTRQGHGVGFWDRGLGDVGKKLTEACKKFGETYFYVGDDGQIFCD